MLPRRERLTRSDIQTLMHDGQKGSGRFFVVRYRRADAPASAFSVGKKVSASAVARHLMKRRAVHAFREVRPAAPLELFFIMKPEARDATYEEMRDDIAFILRQISAKHV